MRGYLHVASRYENLVGSMHLGIRSRWTVFKGLGHHRKENVQAEKRCKSSALGPSTVHRSSERGGGSQGDGEGVAREVGGGPQRTVSWRPGEGSVLGRRESSVLNAGDRPSTGN